MGKSQSRFWRGFVYFFVLGFIVPATGHETDREYVKNLIREQTLEQSQASQDQPYAVVITNDETVFHPFLLGHEIKFLEETFNLPVLAYHARTPDQFREILLDLTARNVLIEVLVLRGIHGANALGEPYFEIVDLEADDFESIGFRDLEKIGVDLNFSRKSVLLFDSCSMIDGSSVDAIKKSFSYLKSIGFESGWIYLNHTDGANATINLFRVPPWARKGWSGARESFLQITGWPVVLPIYFYMDRFVFNQGYLMGQSTRRQIIFETTWQEVRGGRKNVEDIIFRQ